MRLSTTLYGSGSNFARPTKYNAVITLPLLEGNLVSSHTLDVLCKSIVMPSTNNTSQEIKVKGQTVKLPKRSNQVQEITVTFYVDEGYRIHELFHRWINNLDDRFLIPGNTEAPDTKLYNEKYGTILLTALDFYEAKVPISLAFEDVYPMNVSELTMDGTDKDNIHQLTVTFAYYRYKSVYKDV
jgi:hypothetical protein